VPGRDAFVVAMNAEHSGRRVALVAGATRGAGRAIAVEQGRLDVLVNDIFGGDHYAQWDTG
jgi:hypothetical protein